MFDTYVFDMDGTLVDSLPDLVVLTNMALESVGYPPRTTEEIKSFVGNGAAMLIHRACPEGADPDIEAHVLATWRQLYPVYGLANTQAFPGMVDAVADLKAQGKNVAVVSNKFHAALVKVVEKYYPDLFDVVIGEGPDTPRKPDPTGLLRAIEQCGSAPERAVFVGDTHTDLATAKNADVASIILDWGYDTAEFYATCDADRVYSSAREIVAFARADAE